MSFSVFLGHRRQHRNLENVSKLVRSSQRWIEVVHDKCDSRANQAGEQNPQQQSHRAARMGGESRHGGRLSDGHVYDPLTVQGIRDPRLFPLLLVKKIISFRFLDLPKKIFLRRSIHVNDAKVIAILPDDAHRFSGSGMQAREFRIRFGELRSEPLVRRVPVPGFLLIR